MDMTATEFRWVFVKGYKAHLWNKSNVTDLLNKVPAHEMKLVPATVKKIALKIAGV